jgi:outer membrane protein with beta-barrel domain
MRVTRSVVACVIVVLCAVAAAAQEPPPKIGPFVFDLRGTVPILPTSAQLAQSRGLDETDLPGAGFGAEAGVHVYVFKWKAITFGVGADVFVARAHRTPDASNGQTFGHPVTERFVTASPQISFNFGNGNGWSYLTGGIGPSVWQIVPDGSEPSAADEERIRTVNYGGGARWFIKKHVAFNLDVRVYQIDPGTPQLGFVASPRSNIVAISAGVSLR